MSTFVTDYIDSDTVLLQHNRFCNFRCGFSFQGLKNSAKYLL